VFELADPRNKPGVSAALQAIQRAFHSVAALPQHVRVDHGGGNVIVPQQLLDRPDVHSQVEG